MARLFVEGWDPEYGSPMETDEGLAPAESAVDTSVETEDWRPLAGHDDGFSSYAFVDGVRRIDGRVTIDDPTIGPVAGICGTLAVGATLWDRDAKRSEIGEVRVERLAVMSRGRSEIFPEVDFEPRYETVAIPDADPDRLVGHLHTRMRRVEGEAAAVLSERGSFVVADGPLNDLAPQSTVGYIKSHRVTYLPSDKGSVIGALEPGQRTPLFTLSDYQRYSWYLRLARLAGGHSWTGVVRCEASGSLGLEAVRRMADRTAAVLPAVGSAAHTDPRAPQNLVPIAALERELKHRMGDPALVNRGLRAAVARQGIA